MHSFVSFGLQPLYSDGVTITPDAPVSDGLTAASLTDANVTFTWSQFVDPSISLVTAAADVTSRLEWTLQVHPGSGHRPEHLYNWQLVDRDNVVCSETKHSTKHVRNINIIYG